MAVAVERRRFDPYMDARRFAFLTDELRLYEVVAVRDVRRPDDGKLVFGDEPAVKLLDCGWDLPDDPFEAIDRGAWVALEAAAVLSVVEPA